MDTLRSGAFLQSRGWMEIQARIGNVVQKGMIRQKLGPFFYWYVPRAMPPKIDFGKALFVRFDPPAEGGTVEIKELRAAPHDVQPRTTIILDLKKTEEELQAEMHQKCRYNIRVAEREGVRVEKHGIEAFDIFYDLLTQTASRDKFRGHTKEYYANLLEPTSDPELNIFLAIAYVDDAPAAAAMICDYGTTRTYLHGASNYGLRDKMAPFGLHWHLIQDAKAKGFTQYDFWGIAPTDNPKESLAGVTRFKKSWGGEIVRYPQTMDLILRPFAYRMYRLLHRLLRP